MQAPLSIYDISDEVLEVASVALDRGAKSIDRTGEPLAPFVVLQDVRSGIEVRRFLGEPRDVVEDRCRELLRTSRATIVALVYPGRVSHRTTPTDAVFTEVHAAHEGHSVLFAQRLETQPWGADPEGSPMFLGAVEPLRGATAAVAARRAETSRGAGKLILAHAPDRHRRGWRRLLGSDA